MKMNHKKRKVTHQGLKKGTAKNQWTSILEEVSNHSSLLSQAYRLTQKASQVGFDWPNIEGVLKKMEEEMKELKEALLFRKKKRVCEEIGDLLFVIINVSRFLQIDPEEALKKTLDKFISRFHYIETSLRKEGKSFRQSNLIEMDQLWEESKRRSVISFE